MAILLNILTGVFFLVLGIIVLRLAMTHQAPDGRISRFLGVHRMVSPPLGFFMGGLTILLGLFLIVQSVRFLLGHI